jgi:hypothetical protein
MGLTAKVLGGFLLMGLIAVVFAAVGFSSTPSASAYKDFQTEIDNAQTEAQNGGATLKFDASSGSSTLATLTDGAGYAYPTTIPAVIKLNGATVTTITILPDGTASITGYSGTSIPVTMPGQATQTLYLDPLGMEK